MEHRRRTLSSVLDDDIEKQLSKNQSVSIDEKLDEYTEYAYNRSFGMCCRLIKLICCCRNKRVVKVSN